MSKKISQDGKYVKKIDKYQDLYSSSFTFFLVGSIGIIVLLLDFFGIISFSFAPNSKILFYIVMLALFLGFLVIGFNTGRNAKSVKKQIGEEITATNEIINWFIENYTKEKIDSEIKLDESSLGEKLSSEEEYFNREDYIKKILHEKLENLDELFVEQLTEEIYKKYYE